MAGSPGKVALSDFGNHRNDGDEELSGSHTPMGKAMAWVGRIMGACLMMILPGIFGQWLDKKLGTNFLTLIGLGIGLTAGIAGLVAMTSKPPTNPSGDSKH